VAFILVFFTYCTLALYRYNSTSQFLYKVTSVIPFPIARVDGHFVSYNNYLFEIQHYIHYYQTEQGVNFNSTSGKEQLLNYEQQALNKVITDSYINQLASKDHVTVSSDQVNNQINVVRAQNRLGNNQAELADVLKTYYGWSINDFKRELKTQLLAQDLVSKLDTVTHSRAQNVLNLLNSGTSFSNLASEYSDDASTKANGGQYPGTISQNNPSIPAQIMAVLFTLKPGQHSGIINTGSTLEIVENISQHGQQIQAAHISFNFQDVNTYLAPLKQHSKEKIYIHIK
jgi:parvulin-like peptidyl-prolyl isomerase